MRISDWSSDVCSSDLIIKVANLTPAGELDLNDLYAKLSGEVKLLALTHVSNVLGTVNPVTAICREARKRGIVSVVDGSQALPHQPVDEYGRAACGESVCQYV